MSKTLQELVKQLQYLKDWTVEDVAKSIGYSRVHLTKEMKKGDNPDIKALLSEKHFEILQNVSYKNSGIARDARDQELIDSLYSRIEDLKGQLSLNDFAKTLIRIEGKLDVSLGAISDPDQNFLGDGMKGLEQKKNKRDRNT